MKCYYNENDPKVAAWLRELIANGLIHDGVVDERSIADVRANDVLEFQQCHFFAGIGGWSYALRMAGWPDDRPVWTGSCPCQPFSQSGKRKGSKDERHLWPVFFNLIEACRPPIIFGEQVASADVLGKVGRKSEGEAVTVWLDGVFSDLETAHYTCGASDIPAASVGAPHPRQRLYWVAYSELSRTPRLGEHSRKAENEQENISPASRSSRIGGMVQPDSAGSQPGEQAASASRHGDSIEPAGGANGMDDSEAAKRRRVGENIKRGWVEEAGGSSGNLGWLGNPNGSGPQGRVKQGNSPDECASGEAGLGVWSSYDILQMLDGKSRRIESGSFPLAHGVPERVVRLRGYGNAIVPQVAAEFIQASIEAIGP